MKGNWSCLRYKLQGTEMWLPAVCNAGRSVRRHQRNSRECWSAGKVCHFKQNRTSDTSVETWLFTKARVKRQWSDKRYGRDWQSGRLLEMGTECQAGLTVLPAQMEKAGLSWHRVREKLMMLFSSLALQHGSDWAPKEFPLRLTWPQTTVCSKVLMKRDG